MNTSKKEPFHVKLPGGGSIPGVKFTGSRPGKRLVITAGVHGCEYVGVQAARELIDELEPSSLCGQVLILPLVNSSGFYAGARQVVPEDGNNLNRAFPGNPEGTRTFRIAAAIEEQLYPEADFLVDLHSADASEAIVPLAFYPAYAPETVNAVSREAASRLSMEYRVASSAKNGLYSWAAQRGIPALLLERGSRASWSEAEVAACKRNVYEVMEYLQILENRGERKEDGNSSVEIREAVYLEAPHPGFWYPSVREGQRVKKGQALGELRDMEDRLLVRFQAEFDGVVLYYTYYLGVGAGEPLVAYGRLKDV